MTNDIHDDVTVRCWNEETDENGEPITETKPHPDPNAPEGTTMTVTETCGTELTYVEHGHYVRRPRDPDARERFEAAALRFDCPDCGGSVYVCPVCSDPDDHAPAGWFTGESTGEQLPCDNCNQQEIAERRRQGRRGY